MALKKKKGVVFIKRGYLKDRGRGTNSAFFFFFLFINLERRLGSIKHKRGDLSRSFQRDHTFTYSHTCNHASFSFSFLTAPLLFSVVDPQFFSLFNLHAYAYAQSIFSLQVTKYIYNYRHRHNHSTLIPVVIFFFFFHIPF